MNPLQSRKLNCLENACKYGTEIQQHKQKTKFLANATSEFSGNVHDSGDFRPQVNRKSLGPSLDVIYRYSRAYTLKGTV